MAKWICVKADKCKTASCVHKKPHEKLPECPYPDPRLHPLDQCRGAYCVKVDD